MTVVMRKVSTTWLKFGQKGMSANCLRVRHIDVRKEMYNPDYNVDADGYQ